MDASAPNQDRRGFYLALMIGGSGGALGYLVGTGVGSTLTELALALIVEALIVWVISHFANLSRNRIFEAFPGLLIGLAIETLGANFIFGVTGGALGAFAILSWRQGANRDRPDPAVTGIVVWVLLGLVLVGLVPVYLFARTRGIATDALIAYSLVTSPLWLPIILRLLRSQG